MRRFNQLRLLTLVIGALSVAVARAEVVPSAVPAAGDPVPRYTPPSTDPEDIKLGRKLFIHRWAQDDPLAHADGLGPLFNGASCTECHNAGGAGGAGDNTHNISNFEVIPTRADPTFHAGSIHKSTLSPDVVDSPANLRKAFPVVQNGAVVTVNKKAELRAVDPVTVRQVNTPALFGDGLIESIPESEVINHVFPKSSRIGTADVPINSTGLRPGKPRILADGRLGRFGWKAQIATLNEFVAAAAANELGLGTPITVQASPIGAKPIEAAPDLDAAQLQAMTAYVAALPRPDMIVPVKTEDLVFVRKGQALFNTIGCAACHCPDLGGVNGVYSDLLLHDLTDGTTNAFSTLASKDKNASPLPVMPVISATPTFSYYSSSNSSTGNASTDTAVPTSRIRTANQEDRPEPDEWRTPPLWGVAASAPYFHDGSAATLRDAINKHLGDARPVKARWDKLGPDQQYIFAFLLMLRPPADADQVPAIAKAEKRLSAK